MMFSTSSILLTSLVITSTTSHALIVPSSPAVPTLEIKSPASSPNSSVVQQNFVAPPIPILEIGYMHIISQIGMNATIAENQSIADDHRHPGMTNVTLLSGRAMVAECGPDSPCVDGSCCNSEGKCGYTPYNCKNTAATICISNCDAHAMCGVDSLDGAQKCPLNICCSYFGYCGTTDLYCTSIPSKDNPSQSLPCQQGFGSCQVVPPPACKSRDGSASRGRKVGYWQSHNVRDRGCDQVYPNQIVTTGLTHLVFAFLFIDPNTFTVTPINPGDIPLYGEFAALKSQRLQTWIAVGGASLSDQGPTFTTWSDLASSKSTRAAFISSLVDFMNKYGFQGVDLDWETPTIAARGGRPADLENLVLLVQEMRAAFGTKFGISLAIPPDFSSLSGFDAVDIQSSIDFFNFMAYDEHGIWEASYLGAFVRSQASIIDTNNNILPLWFDKVDPNKVNLGIPYYGRGYTLSNTSCSDVGCPYSGPSRAGACSGSPGILSLKEIQDVIQQRNLAPKLIPDIMQKQITWDDQWMGYDDAETFTLKTKWANEHCIGGTVIWSMDLTTGNGQAAPPAPPPAPPIMGLNSTIDGTCGAHSTCLGSTFGQCCSSYGYCGYSPDYCLPQNGCQGSYGLCGTDVPIITPSAVAPPTGTPTATPTAPLTVSVDGSCGETTCLGSTFGQCCSSYGYCGTTSDYCLLTNGCQSDFGLCGTSVPVAPSLSSSSTTPSPPTSTLKVSIDGTCSQGVTCLSSAFGNCCSLNGYCGTGDNYCLVGCQPAFGACGINVPATPISQPTLPPTPPTLKTSIDGSCGNGITCQGSAYGNCCSKSGYCGSTSDYCWASNDCQTSFGSCSTNPPAPVPSLVSHDGSCGNGINCLNSGFGDCCSKNGFCGTTTDYCTFESGCQSNFGTCVKKAIVSVDGTCGATITCEGSPFGNCCSQSGFCGSTDAYCSAGCQVASGVCN